MKRLLIVILVIIIGLCGCSITSIDTTKIQEENDKLKSRISELEEENKNLLSNVEELNKEIMNLEEIDDTVFSIQNDYRIDFESMEEFLAYYHNSVSEDQFREFIKYAWRYDINIQVGTLDDSKILDSEYDINDIITITEPNFMLSLSEYQFCNTILDGFNEIKNSVKIESYNDQIKLLNYENYEEHYGSGTIVDSKMFYVKDVPSGTVIKFEVSDELREWLKMDRNVIEISVKY